MKGKIYEYAEYNHLFAEREDRELFDNAKKEFPNPSEFPYETSVEAVDDKYQEWFKTWFGDEK